MKYLKFLTLFIGIVISTNISLFGQDHSSDQAEYYSQVEANAAILDNEANPSWMSLHSSFMVENKPLLEVGSPTLKEDIFCWRESYGRGVGTIPTVCPNGMENQAGLCYTLCKDGYYGVGPVCWKPCPEGYRDDGAFCAKPEPYGRGAGYPWKFGDPLNDSKMFQRCEAANGKGNCEKDGLIVYPKCRSGFHKVGCCVCSPDCPPGWTDIGVSCTKPSYGRGAGIIPTACAGGKENNAGLCYKACVDNYLGVGPVCWENVCPNVDNNQWVDCGAGCAKTSGTCASSVIDMVTGPLVAVLSIAGMVVTGGGSSAITATAATGKAIKYTAKAVKGVSKVSQLAIKNDLMAKAKEQLNGQPVPEHQKKGIEDYAAMAYDASLAYDFDWRDFAGFDPTGLGSVAAAYANPLCKDIKPKGPGTLAGIINPTPPTNTSPPPAPVTPPPPPVVTPPVVTPPVVTPPAPATMAPVGSDFKRIQNSWYKNHYVHNQNGKIEQGTIQPGWWSAHWKILPVHSGWVRIQNRWYPDRYLHNQNGKLEIGPIQPNWASAMWKLVPAHSGWVRIQNSWYKDHYIHNQNGQIELGPIQPNWASALWKVE